MSAPDIRSAAVQAREALKQLADVIDAAGLGNLSRGVQLGQTVWYVKASDAMDFARKNIAALDAALAAAPAPMNQCDGCMQGAPMRGNLHIDREGRAFMACERDKYVASPSPQQEPRS